jgi:hypothetical protein
MQIINQQDATVSQVYYLTFMCGSTRFARLPAHHQEHTTALAASGFTVGEWRLQRCWSWSGRVTCCILLVDCLNRMMTHGLAKIKFGNTNLTLSVHTFAVEVPINNPELKDLILQFMAQTRDIK